MKLWMCGMSGPGSLEDLKELLEPVKAYVDGIVWVLHDSRDSEEAAYLESVKGAGKVIHYYYSRRHDASRNQYLWCGPIKNGDWIMQCDLLERIPATFAADAGQTAAHFALQGCNIVYYYGKPLLYEYHESLRFVGSPHEGLQRGDGRMRRVELNHYLPDEREVRLNVRPIKRPDPLGWVEHYMRYYLFPWGSNQCLLGNENRPWEGDPMQIFQRRETLRLEFLDYLARRGVERSVKMVKLHFLVSHWTPELARFVNGDKILNDAWRLWVQGDETVRDHHDYRDLPQIDRDEVRESRIRS